MIHHQPSSSLKRAWRSLLAAAIVASTLSAVLPPPAQAATWYVATTGNDANSCTSSAAPCHAINTAINRASDGDVINIAAGVYFENINLSKNLSLTGAGQSVTIIDGSGIGPVILITSDSAGTTANLSGLTLQNGEYGLGGGLHSESGIGLVTVSNSRIIDNVAFTGGGGIFSQGNLKLIDVLVENNVNNGTQRGGGLFNLGAATLTNVSIISNTSNLGGGIGNTGALTLTASIINNNQADEGGGVYNVGSGALFISSNNTYVGNRAGSAGGAIYNATLAIDTGSIITGSQAATSGGGIYNYSTGQLTLNGTILGNNRANAAFGGGLYTDGLATLTNVNLNGNTALLGSGGGIYSAGASGNLSLVDTIVADNHAAANGGGIYAASPSGVLTLINSQIIDNQSDVFGGGLYNNIAANLTSATVSNNRAGSGGGGIYHAGRQIAISRSTLANNQALAGNGGGLSNNAAATLNEVTLQNNQSDNGGGLYNYSSGQLSAANSTWSLNSATLRGGGLHNQGTLTLTQSTVYSNTTISQGGSGLYNASAASAQLVNVTLSYNKVVSSTTGAILNEGGSVTVLNSTISHNAAPALAYTSGSIALANTIIAASIGGVNCNVPLTSNGHNLSSDTSCGFNGAGDLNNTDPQLGPLVNNGGATFTRVLMSNSPALDAGNDGACPTIDQRGVARPQGAHCDIGAYEVIGFTNSTPGPIAAGSCITSSTDVPNSLMIDSLQIGANVTFQPRGDLRIKLFSPGQRISQLLDATGGSGQNLDVLWDDSASDPVGTEDHDPAFPYYDRTRHPDHPLSVMSGASLHGLWKLEICNVGLNTGMLNRWSLIVPNFGNPKVFLPLVRR